MPKNNNQSFSQMYLAKALEGEVKAWVDQGWPGVTQTTLELFNYWFDRGEDVNECFHPCQRRAIETIVYCCEILKAGNLAELFEKAAPEALLEHLPLKQEVETIPFPKYALKMATGSGKTWVLAFLFVVEHPRFRAFYESLKQEGFIIGGGDTGGTDSTGDIIPVDAITEKIKGYDIAWPVQIFGNTF